jgi:hypothetical protein
MIHRSLWGVDDPAAASDPSLLARSWDGIEINLRHPLLGDAVSPVILCRLRDAGLGWIAELVTGGDYVPDLARTPGDHLEDLNRQIRRCDRLRQLGLAPRRLTVITGSDAWSWQEQRRFWDGAMALAERCPLPVSFETHRSRSLGWPWTVERYLEGWPALRITADLSHWCVSAERLMDPTLAPVQAIAGRVDHIHARIGHPQGPQVSHPFAPEHRDALEAHLACWRLFLERSRSTADETPTVTPEFGPDGYLPTLPFTGCPVADLEQINGAMAGWLRQHLV